VSINATLIGQMITFTLLVWFTMKYVWPPLFQNLEDRKNKIAEGLAAAERGHDEKERAEKKAVIFLKEAKEQSAEIVSLANKRANEIVEESKDNAKIEGERLIASAQAQIEQEIQHAREELRKQVSSLVIDAAEQILKSEVDKNKHKNIIKNVSSQLGQA